ncbi:YheC/YheD family protein [Paenibacillus oenotherae]|uniref:YheC/YheD family protein n=1 Tax=Paenibacillus oenotherae TaxID=1435645 RepID=A0ABS7DCI3_9BACL|nr:YheC/YheD family protein [Paenibacillus oenotherae]MBW7477637.1 YheC/YheD family protein [Paenibacillus oenotherae]
MKSRRYNSRPIRGKLRVCNYLTASNGLKRHVPHTVLFTENNLKSMSLSYKSVYIKPDIGSMGIGVYKLNHVSDGFELYSTFKRRQHRQHFGTVSAVYNHIKARHGNRMIIQTTVALDRVNNRPYDIRAMVQRRPGGAWTCTGYLVKIGATPNHIVTNYSQGGAIETIQKLLKRKGLSAGERASRIRWLSNKAIAVCRTLSSKRSGMREMGIDFAYDKNGRLWILEVNSNHPQFHPLKNIDRTAYSRMLSFAKSYGRYSSK